MIGPGRAVLGVVALLHLALALGLAAVPLFDTLGFERAFATGLLTTLTAPAVALHLVRRAREAGGEDPGWIAAQACATSLLLLLPSVLVGVAVEVVSQPCDRQAGLLFMVLLAGGNAAFGSALGVLAAGLSSRARGPAIAIAVVLLGFLAAAGWRAYAEPQIFAYSAPFGFWPGSLYDEELSVSPALWAFRGYTLLFAVTLGLLARATLVRRTLRFGAPRLGPLAAAVAVAAATYGAHRAGGALGFDLDRGSVRDALSLRLESLHFVIHADPSLDREQADLLIMDHELRWAQLSRFFGTAPEGKITSFVYRDTAQKAALMGAGRTQIARPWAHEIHIHGFDVPHPVLKHELAHIFAGQLASEPFRVPTAYGVGVNIGIVEGVAVAADWPVRELTVHGWTRAMKALDLLPDLRTSLSPTGFWSVASSRAYTVAGSFVRYLVDTYGIDALATLYRDNDFEAAYGRDLDALVTEWEAFVDTVPLDEDALVLAEHRFRRPSIFGKVCAHQAANLEQRGRQRLDAGDLDGGLADLQALARYRPSDPAPLVAMGRALARADRPDEAAPLLSAALDLEGATEAARAKATEAIGGLAWRRGDRAEAAAAFREVLERHLSTPSDRLQRARLAALERPPEVQDVLREYLLQDLDRTRALVRLGDLTRAYPEDRLLAYLYGRLLESARAYPEGRRALARAVSGPLPGPDLDAEARLTLGRVTLWAGSATTAAAVFSGLSEAHPSAAIRHEAADWAARARFVSDGELPGK